MLDIIVLFVLAAFVIFRLYSVFGTKGENGGVKIVLKPIDENRQEKMKDLKNVVIAKEKDGLVGLIYTPKEIPAKEDFNKEMFLRGANKVFEMVLHAFNEGNLLPVRDLVSKKVFDAFNKVIDARKEEQITSEVDFIGFKKSEVKEVKKLKNSIKVVVEFVSEQVNLLKNAKGEVIEGDENFVQKITDMWTFERPLNAKNNSWILVSTKKAG